MQLRIAAALGGAVLVSSVALIGAQEQRPQTGPTRWLEAVEHHTPGRDDASVAALQAWPLEELQDALSAFRKLGRPDINVVLERAAVLHTDIAMLRSRPGGYDLPDNGRGSLLIRDGETLGAGTGTYHWEFARACLDALRRGTSTNTDARRWYRAVAATLHQLGDYPEMEVHLAGGLQRFPDDPILLALAGSLHESYAGPHLQRGLDDQQPQPSPAANSRTGPPSALPGSARREQDLADALFRRALKADPTLAEARIRLAEVLDARGRHDEAASELARALAAPLTPTLEYWGRLLLGRAEQARDRLDAAAAAFERAHVLFPNAPSPVLGSSQVARDRGDRTAALRLLAELPDVRLLAEGDDPWWVYYWTHEPDAPTLLRALWRDMVR